MHDSFAHDGCTKHFVVYNTYVLNTTSVFRWYNQIKSYSGAESKKFPGVKDASKYMAAGGAAPAGGDDDDDDVDLFGSSDEEESEEKKRITEERSV